MDWVAKTFGEREESKGETAEGKRAAMNLGTRDSFWKLFTFPGSFFNYCYLFISLWYGFCEHTNGNIANIVGSAKQ